MSEHDNAKKRPATMTIRLYEVRTVVHVYSGHRDVVFHWFARRELGFSRWPHAELIAGYDDLDHTFRCYAGHALDELFDKAEADALAAYLEREHGDEGETTIKEVNMPLPGKILGYGAIAVGGCNDFYTLDKEPAYSLPFRVWGYFDLRGCEPVDKSVPARHQFCSVYIIDGKAITDYDEILNLWRDGKIVAADEVPPILGDGHDIRA